MINKKGAFSMTRDLQLTLFAQSSWMFIRNHTPKNTRTVHTKGADTQMSQRTRKSERKHIKQYCHLEASRANNHPIGLVTLGTNRDAKKKTYAYDPPYGLKYGRNFQPFVNRRVTAKITKIEVHQ